MTQAVTPETRLIRGDPCGGNPGYDRHDSWAGQFNDHPFGRRNRFVIP